ncbi:hypothetical protein VP1G_06966 [Cytospora mali]|uniref:Rhodopsin domain-containing protein n=1 Tax=Cytospora mali TaxID=578113 RepID=A0A194V725_CYTMA|nr:hypothetical protein VP1G_06966 [Valsa mali var. pyri (nom. inval.)]
MKNPYFNPEYNPYPRSVLIGTSVLFIILPIAAVGLRFYSRSIINARLGIDDWITIPSMLICIGLAVNQIVATTLGGLGTHQQLVDGQLAHTDQLYTYEKTKYTYQVLGTIGLCVIKLSVLFFYRRIFTVRAFRILNNCFIGLTIAWGVAFTFTVAFQCYPVSTFWNKFESEYAGHCVVVQKLYLAVALSDMLLDIIIFVLPIPHLYSLQMPLRRKLAVGAIFFLGSIVVACGITRVIIFEWVISFMTVNPMLWVTDTTWYSSGVLFWHLTENVVGLVGCCLPTYRPFFKKHLSMIRLSKSGSSSNTSDANTAREKSYHAHLHAHYHRHQDDEWPLKTDPTGRTPNKSLASTSFGGPSTEDHELGSVPQNRIVVQTEFRTETSMV